ncbi:NAD/NADP octopine/nopaline dehydrogenase family protein (plasmid) [Agrobacterium tumefaciens]
MNANYSVSVIGAGNCGCAFAADLSRRGINVLLYGHPKHRRNIDAIREKGGLTARMKIEGVFHPATTTDMAEAVKFSRFLIVGVPSYGHEDIIAELEKFDLSNHTVAVMSGNFFTFAAFGRLNAKLILEANGSTYASRMSDGEIIVTGIKANLPIASFPANISTADRKIAADILGVPLHWYKNILEIGMFCTNGVLHAIPAILNTGWIESTKGDFYFYRDGISPSVGNVVETADRERLKICEVFGFKLPTVLEELTGFYGGNYERFSDFAYHTKVHNATKAAPASMHDRFIAEDIPYVLVPWCDLAALVGVKVPTMRAVVELACVINGINYFETGRTLKRLGIAHLSKRDLLHLVDNGDVRSSELYDYREPIGHL